MIETNENIFLNIPEDYRCIYNQLLIKLNNLDKNLLTDCDKLCNGENKHLITCWNMFQSACASYALGYYKKSNFLISYIKAQLNLDCKFTDTITRSLYYGYLSLSRLEFIDLLENGNAEYLYDEIINNNTITEIKNNNIGKMINNVIILFIPINKELSKLYYKNEFGDHILNPNINNEYIKPKNSEITINDSNYICYVSYTPTIPDESLIVEIK